MSERKSAEIKFRCTPSFKASALAAASAADQSLTEFIESAVWAHQNAKLDGTALVDNAIRELRDIGAGESGAVAELMSWKQPPVELLLDADDLAVIAAVPNAAVPEGEAWLVDSVEVGTEQAAPLAVISNITETCACRPWEYCTHKASA